MRLIDADALLDNGIKVSFGFNNDGIVMLPMGDVRKSIEEAPTIDPVHAAGGCYCRECAYCYWEHEPRGVRLVHYCEKFNLQVNKRDFCSYGSRRKS